MRLRSVGGKFIWIQKMTSHPTIFITMNPGSLRRHIEGVVVMRGPNSQTKRVNFPLPRIEDLLPKQGKCQIFSVLDVKMAFHQKPLHPESWHITCCHTHQGFFQLRVNVMGLTNASQQFQQLMEDRLQPERDVADPYIDDIIFCTWLGPDYLRRTTLKFFEFWNF